MHVIFEALAFSGKRERFLINVSQVATSKVGQIADVWASQGESKREPKDFLPFALEEDDPAKSRISAEAAATIRGLIRRRELPLTIIAELMEDLEQHRGAPGAASD